MLGVKRVERVLPVGTALTVVGEVSMAFFLQGIKSTNVQQCQLLHHCMCSFFRQFEMI
jgi:hypothetical protein